MGEVSLLADLKNLSDKDESLFKKLGGLDGISKKLESSLDNGLSSSMITNMRVKYGENTIPEPESATWLELFWESFEDQTVIILLVSAAVSLAIGVYQSPTEGWIEGSTIFLAVFIVAVVTACNNYEKEKQFRSLSIKEKDTTISVRRDGDLKIISVNDIVVGDIVVLGTGDKIPADGILIDGSDVKCDESSMTGESDEVEKSAPNSVDYFMLSGTTVTSGYCSMLVIAVGINSRWGQVVGEVERMPTPLQEKLEVMADLIGKGGIIAATGTFIGMLAMWYLHPETHTLSLFEQTLEAFIMAVAIVVVAVPEGLPLAVTLSLAFSSGEMMKDNNLIRHLEACETMGNATTICSDKTGTLTKNKMTVVEVVVSDKHFTSCPTEAQIDTAKMSPLMERIATAVSVNSTAFLESDGRVIGNKTEGALLLWMNDLNFDYSAIRSNGLDFSRGDKLFTFNSNRKMMSALQVKTSRGGQLWTKGAAETLLKLCTSVMGADGKSVSKLTSKKYDELVQKINTMASQQLRTIAIGYTDVSKNDFDKNPEELEKNLTLMCIVGIKDPLRDDVKSSIEKCKDAGIFVRMVTGDNIETAKAIAKECGILSNGIAMEGPEFRRKTPAELDEILPKLEVLARATPKDKYILVTRLNGTHLPRNEEDWKLENPEYSWENDRHKVLPGYREEWEEARKDSNGVGEVVSVTGDGTNDAPALRTADVGLSMGLSGTDVAKEASKIVILDDSFSSIVAAVAWGRSVFDNIRKFLQFQLTVNIVALVVTLIEAIGNSKPTLNAVMMLWVNLIMDTMGALALGTDPPTPELLNRRPYKRDAPLINIVMWRNILVQSAFQLTILLLLNSKLGADIFRVEENTPQHTTIVFNVFVLCQVVNEFNARSIGDVFDVFAGLGGNLIFNIIIILTIGIQYLIVQYGGMFVGTEPLTPFQWYRSALLAALTLPMGGVMRLIPIKENENDFASNSLTTNYKKKGSTSNGLTLTFSLWMLLVLNIPYLVYTEFSEEF